MKIAISVIIVTYNQQETIKETLESIINQSFHDNFEIIVGDDCSTDNTAQICIEYKKKYPDFIRYIRHSENRGVVNNWFSCFSDCKGKYIMNCAGDDYWQNPHKMKIQYSYMEENEKCGILHTDYDQLNIRNNKIIKSFNYNKNITTDRQKIMHQKGKPSSR